MLAIRLGFWTLVISLALSGSAPERNFAIIVNRSNKFESLNRTKVAAMFMGKISRWPWGAEAIPIDLRDSSAIKSAFVKAILKSSFEELKVYWIDQKITTNVNPPFQAVDGRAAKLLVASKPGAIAYIPRELVDESVKELKVE
jgi:ABC-type phosphate transport system substrate-binding protein